MLKNSVKIKKPLSKVAFNRCVKSVYFFNKSLISPNKSS